MDAGILLRIPSRLNNMSQPVKFGEYLSAGLPVILQDGPKNVSEILHTYQIGCVIDISGKEDPTVSNEVRKALDWVDQNKVQSKRNARAFVAQQYTWNANVQKEREMYVSALNAGAPIPA
jgi:glycosyltransferase involved in cell wall biosynthesis